MKIPKGDEETSGSTENDDGTSDESPRICKDISMTTKKLETNAEDEASEANSSVKLDRILNSIRLKMKASKQVCSFQEADDDGSLCRKRKSHFNPGLTVGRECTGYSENIELSDKKSESSEKLNSENGICSCKSDCSRESFCSCRSAEENHGDVSHVNRTVIHASSPDGRTKYKDHENEKVLKHTNELDNVFVGKETNKFMGSKSDSFKNQEDIEVILCDDFKRTFGLFHENNEEEKKRRGTERRLLQMVNCLMSPDSCISSKLNCVNSIDPDNICYWTASKVLQDPDRIARCICPVIDGYLLNRGDKERDTLVQSLAIFNKLVRICRAQGQNLTALSNCQTNNGFTLLQSLFLVSSPNLVDRSPALVMLMNKLLSALEPSQKLMAKCSLSEECQDSVLDDLRKCLFMTSAERDSTFLQDMSAWYNLVTLYIHDGSKELSLAGQLLDMDESGELCAVERQSQPCSKDDDLCQIEIVKIYPSGHLLCYLGKENKQELKNMEERCNLCFEESAPISVDTLKPGTMLLVNCRESVEELNVARRAILISISMDGLTASVYFPDYGEMKEVDVQRIKLIPDKLRHCEPLVKFCRLQGIGSAANALLSRHSICSCSHLVTSETASSLLSDPSLNSLKTLMFLLESADSGVQNSTIKIIKVLCEERTCIEVMSQSRTGSPPTSLQLVASGILFFLKKTYIKNRGSKIVDQDSCHSVVKCLFNILNTVQPNQMKLFIKQNNSLFSELIHVVETKNKEVIERILMMPTKGNNYVPVKTSADDKFTIKAVRSKVDSKKVKQGKTLFYKTNPQSKNFSNKISSDSVINSKPTTASKENPVWFSVSQKSAEQFKKDLDYSKTSSNFIFKKVTDMFSNEEILKILDMPKNVEEKYLNKRNASFTGSDFYISSTPSPIPDGARTQSQDIYQRIDEADEEEEVYYDAVENVEELDDVKEIIDADWKCIGIKENINLVEKKECKAPVESLHSKSMIIETRKENVLKGETVNQAKHNINSRFDCNDTPEVEASFSGLVKMKNKENFESRKTAAKENPKELINQTTIITGLQEVNVTKGFDQDPKITSVSSHSENSFLQHDYIEATKRQDGVVKKDLKYEAEGILDESFDLEYLKARRKMKFGYVMEHRRGITVEYLGKLGTTLKDAGVLAVLITAMANTIGGSIIIGVKGEGLVCGLSLSRREKDEFAQMVDLITTQLISPRFSQFDMTMDYIPVESARGTEDRWMIRIIVRKQEGKVYITQNIPDAEAAMYKRSRKGPNFTYKVPIMEAAKEIDQSSRILCE